MQKLLPLVVMDIDNTLIPVGEEISAANFESITKYLENNGRIAFATGKVPYAIENLISELGLNNTYHIAGNGGILFCPGENNYLELSKLGKDSKPLIEKLYEVGITAYIYYSNQINRIGVNTNQDEINRLLALGEPRPQKNDNIDYKRVLKILFYINVADIEQETRVRSLLNPYLEDYHFIRTSNELLEIHHRQQTKANALQKYADMFDVDLKDVYAVGDSENDIPMLELVGHPYIVGNADASLITQYSNVLPSCKENGISVLLETLLK